MATGKFALSRSKVVRGGPAYIVGVLLMLPLPLAFAAGFVIGAVSVARTGGPPGPESALPIAGIEFAIGLTCLIAALVVANVNANKPQRRSALRVSGSVLPPVPPTDPKNPYASPAPPINPDDIFGDK